jgi:tetratricopeptide (TPR) repeat protein
MNMQDEDHRNVQDHNTALMLAHAAKAKWLLKGTIIQEEPVIILATQLIDAENGSLFATGRVEGERGLSVFDLIDRLTVKIKASLSLPEQALTEEDPPVTYVTTTSLNAYKHYLEGVDYLHKFYLVDAIEAFMKSLEYDSTMAMSYYYLSVLVDSSYIVKAVKYSDKAPRLNRKYILAAEAVANRNLDSAITIWKDIASNFPDQKHANYLIGSYRYEQSNYGEALEYLEKAIEIDPNFKLPYRGLAYTHLKLSNHENAVEAANKYVSLAPDEAEPYDCLGDIYVEIGRTDDAIKAYGEALEVRADISITTLKLGKAHFWKGQLDSALTLFHKVSNDDYYFVRSEARLSMACIESVKGNFLKSMQMLDEYIAADIEDKNRERYPLFRSHKAILYDLMNRNDSALVEIDKCLSIYRKADFAYYVFHHSVYYYNVQSYHIQLIAFSGLSDSAKVLTDHLVADLNEKKLPLMPYYQATGVIALAEDRYDEAVEFLTKAIHPDNPLHILSRYLLGEAYLESGDFNKARDSYRDLTTNYYHDCTLWCTFQVLAHYKLGLAYYQLGEYGNSKKELEKFIDIWGKADIIIDEIEDARAILAQLKRS